MKTATIIISALFFLVFTGYSQINYNQVDTNGKKQGAWIVYLDSQWAETDSSNATYYFYTHYENDVNTIPIGKSGKKGWVLTPKLSSKSKPIELSGEYKWTDQKGVVRSIHKFENGEYISLKEFDKTGALLQFFDYGNQFEDEPNSYYVTVIKKEKETKFVMRNGSNGWMLYNDPGVGSDDD